VPKTGLSAAQKKAAAKAKAKANAAARAKANAVSEAILDGQAQPLQPLQSPSKQMKTGLLAISMAIRLKNSKKKKAQAAPALPPENSKKAKSAPALPGELPPGQPQGPLQGKLLRVTSEKAGLVYYGAQGKCLQHNLSTGTVSIETEAAHTVMVRAEYCEDASGFRKKTQWMPQTGLSRVHKAECLDDLGLSGHLHVLQVEEEEGWMENEIMEGGLWLMRWNFEKHGYSMKQVRLINPTMLQVFFQPSAQADPEGGSLKVKHTAYIRNSLKREQGEKIRVLMPNVQV